MIQAIILIVLAIVIAPILLPGLIGNIGIMFTIYKEGFSNPDILVVIFATITAVWFLGVWGKAGKGRKKTNRIGLFDLNFKPLTYNSECEF